MQQDSKTWIRCYFIPVPGWYSALVEEGKDWSERAVHCTKAHFGNDW